MIRGGASGGGGGMAMKRRGPEQGGMWVATQALPRSPGHVFYEKLNQVLEAGGFER